MSKGCRILLVRFSFSVHSNYVFRRLILVKQVHVSILIISSGIISKCIGIFNISCFFFFCFNFIHFCPSSCNVMNVIFIIFSLQQLSSLQYSFLCFPRSYSSNVERDHRINDLLYVYSCQYNTYQCFSAYLQSVQILFKFPIIQYLYTFITNQCVCGQTQKFKRRLHYACVLLKAHHLIHYNFIILS